MKSKQLTSLEESGDSVSDLKKQTISSAIRKGGRGSLDRHRWDVIDLSGIATKTSTPLCIKCGKELPIEEKNDKEK